MTFPEYIERLRLAAGKRLQSAMHTEMGAVVEEAAGLAKGRLSGSVLNVRSGNLRRSVLGIVDPPQGAVIQGRIRAGGGSREVSYARIHEEGGTIVPNGNSGGGGKWLAIPTRLAPGGQTKHTARDVPGLRFQPTKRADVALLVRDRKRRNKAGHMSDVLYILVKSVRIPKRPYLAPSAREASADLAGRMNRAMDRLMAAT